MSPERVETEVDGRRLSLSNLDKVLFPKTGFTKRALLDYYARIAPVMVPHLADRPVTLRRWPDGTGEGSFFEKHVPSHAPEWVRTVKVPTAEGEGPRRRAAHKSEEIEYAVIDDRASLVWAANLATIEFHVPLWRARPGLALPTPPDHLVFDLDPGPSTSIVECCRVAGWISERLVAEGAEAQCPKTSGSKGLQLYVRLARPFGDWTSARERALELAQGIEREHGDLVVTNMRKELRKGRVLIDWSQNHPAKTTVAAYSMRGLAAPTVSTPVTLEEVAACARSGDAASLRFDSTDVLARVDRLGDLMAAFAEERPPHSTKRH